MIKLSAVIITYNEQEHLEKCLESLIDVADEIIVVDSFSTDQTQAICETFKVKFIQHKFEGYIEQKNYAMSLASYDYILLSSRPLFPAVELALQQRVEDEFMVELSHEGPADRHSRPDLPPARR